MGLGMGLKARVVAVALIGTISIIFVANFITLTALSEKDRRAARKMAVTNADLFIQGAIAPTFRPSDRADPGAEGSSSKAHLFDRLGGAGLVDYRIAWGESLQSEYGPLESNRPIDEDDRAILNGLAARTIFSAPSSIKLIAPILADERCGSCHHELSGDPVAPGALLAALTLYFDFGAMVTDSESIAERLTYLLTFVMIALVGALLIIVHLGFSRPMRRLASALRSASYERIEPYASGSGAAELVELANAGREGLRQLESRRKEGEERLLEFIRGADQIGAMLGEGSRSSQIDLLARKVSDVIAESERARMIERARAWLIGFDEEMEFPARAENIQPVASYFGALFTGAGDRIDPHRVELALDEAISNAVYHGALEVDSKIKDRDFDQFLDEVERRSSAAPYNRRTIKARARKDGQRLVVRIIDPGGGFDFEAALAKKIDSEGEPAARGRGILIMRFFANRVEYFKNGSVVELSFWPPGRSEEAGERANPG